MSREVICKPLGSSLIVSASNIKLLEVASPDITLPLITAPKSIVYLAICDGVEGPDFTVHKARQTWWGTQFGGSFASSRQF